MANDLIFYTNPMSRGRVIRWALEEVGQPYKTEIMEYGTTMKAAPYLAINPFGKVPALRHGDAVVTETCAIAMYLADAFPAAGLAPAHGDKARADYYRWILLCAGPLEAAVTDKSLNVVVPQDKQGFVGYGSLETVLSAFEKMLDGRDYIAGGKFSMADLIVGSYLNFYMSFNSIEKNPVFVRYVDNLKKRPAWIHAIEIDDKLMAQQSKQAGHTGA